MWALIIVTLLWLIIFLVIWHHLSRFTLGLMFLGLPLGFRILHFRTSYGSFHRGMRGRRCSGLIFPLTFNSLFFMKAPEGPKWIFSLLFTHWGDLSLRLFDSLLCRCWNSRLVAYGPHLSLFCMSIYSILRQVGGWLLCLLLPLW